MLPDDTGIRKFIGNEHTNYDSLGERVFDAKVEFRKELERLGIHPSYGNPTIFRVNRGLFIVMANHEYDVRVDDADAIGEATMRARREVVDMTEALVKESQMHPGKESPWRGLRLVATADQIYHRRARRIHGRYTMASQGEYRVATALYGSGQILAQDGAVTAFKQGSGVFLPADFGHLTFQGDFTFLCSDGEVGGSYHA